MGREYSESRQPPSPKLDNARPLMLRRACNCGCDNRDGDKGAGYITGADGKGSFFTVWLEKEETFQAAKKVFKKHKLKVLD